MHARQVVQAPLQAANHRRYFRKRSKTRAVSPSHGVFADKPILRLEVGEHDTHDISTEAPRSDANASTEQPARFVTQTTTSRAGDEGGALLLCRRSACRRERCGVGYGREEVVRDDGAGARCCG